MKLKNEPLDEYPGEMIEEISKAIAANYIACEERRQNEEQETFILAGTIKMVQITGTITL